MPCKVVRTDPPFQPQQEAGRADFHDEHEVAQFVERKTVTYFWYLAADVAADIVIEFPGGPDGFSLAGTPESRPISPELPAPLIVVARGIRYTPPPV